MAAHSVIFMPAKNAKNAKGTVYIFGGIYTYATSYHHQQNNYKYDIAANKWTRLQGWDKDHCRYSFNLLPVCDF